MLRAISYDTTHRPAIRSTHHARPESKSTKTEAEGVEISMDVNNEERMAYVEFIGMLLHKMNLKGLKLMLDLALRLIDK